MCINYGPFSTLAPERLNVFESAWPKTPCAGEAVKGAARRVSYLLPGSLIGLDFQTLRYGAGLGVGALGRCVIAAGGNATRDRPLH